MKRRTFLGGTIAVTTLGLTSGAGAQQAPIKIGMSMVTAIVPPRNVLRFMDGPPTCPVS